MHQSRIQAILVHVWTVHRLWYQNYSQSTVNVHHDDQKHALQCKNQVLKFIYQLAVLIAYQPLSLWDLYWTKSPSRSADMAKGHRAQISLTAFILLNKQCWYSSERFSIFICKSSFPFRAWYSKWWKMLEKFKVLMWPWSCVVLYKKKSHPTAITSPAFLSVMKLLAMVLNTPSITWYKKRIALYQTSMSAFILVIFDWAPIVY